MCRIFKSLIGLCLLFLVVLISGCTERQQQKELSVFAAISLKDALSEIGATFTDENQVKVYYNFAASTTLQRQLEKGTSGDVFISASSRQVVALETHGLLESESRHNLLTNRLVLVSDAAAAISVETPTNLVSPEISRIAIGHPDIVPAGAYAKEALTHFGLWETLQPKLIFGTDVRATLAYVTAGNVDIAIVYKTDTTLTENINVLYELPPEAYTPIIYPAVVMKSSPQKHLARRFITYLQSMENGEIFKKHGFTLLAKMPPTQHQKSPKVKSSKSTDSSFWTKMRITPAEVAALTLSIKIALLSLIIMFPPGLLVGWLLAKRTFPGKAFLNTLVMCPQVLPPIVSGYILLILLGKQGVIGRFIYQTFGIEIVFSQLAVVIAVSVISFPLLVRGIVTGMEGVPLELENTARTLGASPMKVFWTITLPLAYRGVIGGTILGFSKSLGEFGATIMVAGNIPGQTQTMALAIFSAVHLGEDVAVYRLVFISTVVAFAAIWLTERFTLR